MARQICPKCRAVYDVIMRGARLPVEDHFDCVVRGEQLRSWKPSRYPEFHFAKSGQKPANRCALSALCQSRPRVHYRQRVENDVYQPRASGNGLRPSLQRQVTTKRELPFLRRELDC